MKWANQAPAVVLANSTTLCSRHAQYFVQFRTHQLSLMLSRLMRSKPPTHCLERVYTKQFILFLVEIVLRSQLSNANQDFSLTRESNTNRFILFSCDAVGGHHRLCWCFCVDFEIAHICNLDFPLCFSDAWTSWWEANSTSQFGQSFFLKLSKMFTHHSDVVALLEKLSLVNYLLLPTCYLLLSSLTPVQNWAWTFSSNFCHLEPGSLCFLFNLFFPSL